MRAYMMGMDFAAVIDKMMNLSDLRKRLEEAAEVVRHPSAPIKAEPVIAIGVNGGRGMMSVLPFGDKRRS